VAEGDGRVKSWHVPGVDDRARALALLRRHGWNTTSFQLLEEGFAYWFDGDDAFVAYFDTGSAWVAGGAPVADPARLADVARAFVDAAGRAGRRACFFAVEDRFLAATGFPSLHVGEQPTWDPRRWDDALAASSTLRYQVKRARGKGVTVRVLDAGEIADAGAPARRQAEALIARWLGRRDMAPMGFLVDVQPFAFPDERLYIVAEQGGRVVGFLSAVPVYARGGWFFEDLLRDPDAPNGTAELLVDAGMRAAAARGAQMVTLGLAPLAGRVPAPLRVASVVGAPLYDFRGLHAFKSKLRPDAWQPVYLAAAPRRSTWIALVDSLKAFAGGSLVGFGLRTLARGPVGLVWLLTAALMVWTPLLALAPAACFPSPAVQWAWVGFDALLALSLWSLSRRYRAWLATTLATVVSADVLLTTLQAALFNLRRIRSPIDTIAAVIAVTGPSLAAIALWGMVLNRRRVQP
jgi:phosphatidylglycerol lysyltransferase